MPRSEAAGATLRVDLAAIAGNYRLLAERAAPARVAAVLKADAYGLGAAQVGPALAAAGCRRFFVAHGFEGEALRAALPEVEIFVLHGPPAGCEAEFRAHRLVPVLNDLAQIERWRRQAGGGPLPAALHVDTGMNRLGLSEPEVARLAAEPERLSGIAVGLVLSHLVVGEAPADPTNERQRQRFERLRARLPGAPASLANSSGSFLGTAFHYDWVRPGAALYGINPTPGRLNPMREVVGLSTPILALREVAAGEGVGYGPEYRATATRRIATVAVGYADGYARVLGGRAEARLAGRVVPLVGRVSMDLITLDVSDVPRALARTGAMVDLIGGGIAIDDLADRAGTNAYELLTRLCPRLARVHGPTAEPAA
ncbi:MAG: alanine racemase [Alphaproteobacteria bacterium]|nr:alanine racemase [Alphaproteobacteria bacterium]